MEIHINISLDLDEKKVHDISINNDVIETAISNNIENVLRKHFDDDDMGIKLGFISASVLPKDVDIK